MRNVSRNYKPSSPLHPLPRGFDRGQTRSARWTEKIGSGGAYKRAALCIVDSLCPRGCSETEVGARVPPGRSRTRRLRPLSVAIGYRASEASYGVTAAAQAKALRMAFADSWGRRGLTRESLNLDAPPPHHTVGSQQLNDHSSSSSSSLSPGLCHLPTSTSTLDFVPRFSSSRLRAPQFIARIC